MSQTDESLYDYDYEDYEEENYGIKPNIIVGDNYRIVDKLGSGSFGQIYMGITCDKNEKVAIKFERQKCYGGKQLLVEERIYQLFANHEGFPKIYWCGQCDRFNVLVMELLGKNLEQVFQLCKYKFTMPTILYIVLELLDRMEYIHSKSILYRDVKPENFVLGPPESPTENMVYVIDFGLSKQYIDSATGKHIPMRECKNLTGTARYMSINTHRGYEQSRRDDLEALAHLFIYFLRDGKLPWSGLKEPDLKQRYKMIGDIKQKYPITDLCQGFPEVFQEFLQYTRSLKFQQQPDYKTWQNKFESLYSEFRQPNMKYDWSNKIKRDK